MQESCHETVMSKPPLRICLVAPLPPPFGGIATWTGLMRQYAQDRTDVGLHIVDTAPRWRAIDDLSLWKRALGGGIQLIRDYARFCRVLRVRPDIIHLTTSGQLSVVRDLTILATARRLGIPTVYHIRFGRIPEIASANTGECRMLARAIGLAHTVIAIDPSTAETIGRLFPKARIIRIPNGVDFKELPPPQSPSPMRTLIYLGWVIPAKGMSELLQAWVRLPEMGWRCLVVGSGSEKYRQELLERFHPRHLEFLPAQPHAEAMRLLASAEAFVLPSHTEGFPNVVVEAMAMGKPIIATRVGAIPEMLSDGCGMLIPPKDADALQAAMHSIFSNADVRAAMGTRAGHKARQTYAMDKVFEQCVSLWRDVSSSSLIQ